MSVAQIGLKMTPFARRIQRRTRQRFAHAAVLIAACAAAAGIPAQAGAVDTGQPSLIDQAKTARYAGEFTAAIALANDALSETPDNTDALVLLGYSYLAQGQLDAAETSFQKTLVLAPDYHDATLGLAYVFFRRGNTEEAVQLARRVLEAVPDYRDAEQLIDAATPAPPVRPRARPARSVAAPVTQNSHTPALPAARPKPRNILAAAISQARGDRDETDLTLNVVRIDPNGTALGFGLRRTSRFYGDATQISVSASKLFGPYDLHGEIAIADGAPNLPDLKLRFQATRALNDRVTLRLETAWARYSTGRTFTATPAVTVRTESGATLSLRLPTGASSEASGAATVIDMRTRLPLNDRMELRAGAAVGQEFDQAVRRDVRSLSAGITRTVNDAVSVSIALSSGPYADTDQLRLDLGVTRRF